MSIHADLRLRQWLGGRPVGVISRPEALALGFTDRMIRRRLESGWWSTLAPGLYGISGEFDEWRAVLAAAVSKLLAVVSHHSAAQLLGFPMTPRGKLVVSVPHRTTHTFPGVEVRQSTDLTEDYVAEVDGLRTTNVARTVFDIAHHHKLSFLHSLIEQLVVAGHLNLDELAAALARLGRRGRPGTVRTRKALAAISPAIERLESELERLVLDLIRQAGLPLPMLQYPLPWRSSRPGRVDMAYPGLRLIIECDGRRWHLTAQTFEDDRKRDNLAIAAGWRVIRITWRMAVEDPQAVVETIRTALGTPAAG